MKDELPSNLDRILLQSLARGDLASCAIKPDSEEFEKRTDDGLVMGHAYAITNVILLSK